MNKRALLKKQKDIHHFNKIIYLKHFPKMRALYFENIGKHNYSLCSPLPRNHINSRIFCRDNNEDDKSWNLVKNLHRNTNKVTPQSFTEDILYSNNQMKQIYNVSNFNRIMRGSQNKEYDNQIRRNEHQGGKSAIGRNENNWMQRKEINKENPCNMFQVNKEVNMKIFKEISKVILNSIEIFLN